MNPTFSFRQSASSDSLSFATSIPLDVALAFGRSIDARNDVKQCRLAGAGRTHQRQKLSGFDIHADVIECAHLCLARTVNLGEVSNGNDRVHCGF